MRGAAVDVVVFVEVVVGGRQQSTTLFVIDQLNRQLPNVREISNMNIMSQYNNY